MSEAAQQSADGDPPAAAVAAPPPGSHPPTPSGQPLPPQAPVPARSTPDPPLSSRRQSVVSRMEPTTPVPAAPAAQRQVSSGDVATLQRQASARSRTDVASRGQPQAIERSRSGAPTAPLGTDATPAATPLVPTPLVRQASGGARSLGSGLHGPAEDQRSHLSARVPSHSQLSRKGSGATSAGQAEGTHAPAPGTPGSASAGQLHGTVRSAATPVLDLQEGRGSFRNQPEAIPTAPIGSTPPMAAMAPAAVGGDTERFERELAARDAEIVALQQQVDSLQRLHVNATGDMKLKLMSDERTKVAGKLKDAEARLATEQSRAQKEIKARDDRIAELSARVAASEKKQSSETQQSKAMRKSIAATEGQAVAAMAQVASLESQISQLRAAVEQMRQVAARAEAERDDAVRKLQKSQEAIVSSTAVGYENEVKLHQARAALHLILRELSSPENAERLANLPAEAGTPARLRFNYSPTRRAVGPSATWASTSPESFTSQLLGADK